MKKRMIGSALAMAMAEGLMIENIPWYRRRRHRSHPTIRFSKHKPHQGERERARRRRQIERGIIPQDQLYVRPA